MQYIYVKVLGNTRGIQSDNIDGKWQDVVNRNVCVYRDVCYVSSIYVNVCMCVCVCKQEGCSKWGPHEYVSNLKQVFLTHDSNNNHNYPVPKPNWTHSFCTLIFESQVKHHYLVISQFTFYIVQVSSIISKNQPFAPPISISCIQFSMAYFKNPTTTNTKQANRFFYAINPRHTIITQTHNYKTHTLLLLELDIY